MRARWLIPCEFITPPSGQHHTRIHQGSQGMGKVEKVVVLGVLFIIVSILALSLDGGLGELGSGGSTATGGSPVTPLAAESGSPRGASTTGRGESALRRERGRRVGEDQVERRAPLGASLGAAPTQGEPEGPSALLTAEVDPSAGNGMGGESAPYDQPTAPAKTVAAPQPDWDLVTLDGLEDHPFDPDLKTYKAQGGDDFTSLSQRLYGDAAHAALLRRNNEGTRTIEAGQVLLVPVASEEGETGTLYEVVPGDSLSGIAFREYGKGHLSDLIFDANKDVLASPDKIAVGMRLFLPSLPVGE